MTVAAPPKPPSEEPELLIPEARARQRRRWLGGAALVAGLAGGALGVHAIVGGGTSTLRQGHGVSSAAGPPRCRAAQLRLSVTGGGVAAGTSGASFAFTDTSAAACTLHGWPSLRLVLRGGRVVSAVPRHELTLRGYSVHHPPPVPRVVLRPGATTPWSVFAADGTGLNHRCPWSRRVLVVPPGSRAPLAVKATVPYCDDGRYMFALPVGRLR